MNRRLGLLSLCALSLVFQSGAVNGQFIPVAGRATDLVRVDTNMGDFYIELYGKPGDSPAHVINFLQYALDGEFDNNIFHRTVSSSISVVQGGGFLVDGTNYELSDEVVSNVNVRGPVFNEFNESNGLSNMRTTVAAARTADPNSATSQWYVNVEDNTGLDSGPYTVFGAVVYGMDVVDTIGQLPHHNSDAFDGSPYEVTFRELPATSSGEFVVMYSVSEIAIKDPDFNDDGVVDSVDFASWLEAYSNMGGSDPGEGDSDRDGDVDGNDFLLWQSAFDPVIIETAGGGGFASVTAVPEPSGVTLLLASLLFLTGARRYRR